MRVADPQATSFDQKTILRAKTDPYASLLNRYRSVLFCIKAVRPFRVDIVGGPQIRLCYNCISQIRPFQASLMKARAREFGSSQIGATQVA